VPEYPGIYVEEIVPGKSIEGVPTGTSAFVELIDAAQGRSSRPPWSSSAFLSAQPQR
jgi:hypothetical protein